MAVFQMMRRTAFTSLNWDEVDVERLELIKRVVMEPTRAVLLAPPQLAMNTQQLWFYCVIIVNLGSARWFLLRNYKTHCRTGEDFVSRVGHFKKNLVGAGRQSNQDNRVFAGVRPCTFPVVDGDVEVTETW